MIPTKKLKSVTIYFIVEVYVGLVCDISGIKI